MSAPGLHRAVPALPVRDASAAVASYREKLGFEAPYQDVDFAVLTRDESILNLWQAADEGWRTRPDFTERPVKSGAESFLAGTGSCRIEVADVDAMFAELRANDALHPASAGGITDTDFGAREVNAVDLDGNLITFFRFGSVDG